MKLFENKEDKVYEKVDYALYGYGFFKPKRSILDKIKFFYRKYISKHKFYISKEDAFVFEENCNKNFCEEFIIFNKEKIFIKNIKIFKVRVEFLDISKEDLAKLNFKGIDLLKYKGGADTIDDFRRGL